MNSSRTPIMRCTQCGKIISAPRFGRPPKYCAECRVEAKRRRSMESYIRRRQMTPHAGMRDYHLLHPLDDWGDAPCFSPAEVYYMLRMRILPPGAVLERKGKTYRVILRGGTLALQKCG